METDVPMASSQEKPQSCVHDSDAHLILNGGTREVNTQQSFGGGVRGRPASLVKIKAHAIVDPPPVSLSLRVLA